jgi:hypothetical protein
MTNHPTQPAPGPARTDPRPSPAQLRELYLDDPLSTYQIAELVGVSHTTIWNWLKAAGIPRRPRTWAAGQLPPRPSRRPARPRSDAGHRRRPAAAAVPGRPPVHPADRQDPGRSPQHRLRPSRACRDSAPRPGRDRLQEPGRKTLWALHRQQGLSLAEIGRRYGVCDRAVAKWLVAVGIPLPGRGRRPPAPAGSPPAPPRPRRRHR